MIVDGCDITVQLGRYCELDSIPGSTGTHKREHFDAYLELGLCLE